MLLYIPWVAFSAGLDTSNTIMSAKLINDRDTIYSMVMTKNSSNNLVAYVYTNSGGTQNSYDYGAYSSATGIYLLPLDRNSNQNVQDVLIFASTTSGLETIYSSRIQSAAIQSATNMLTINPIIGVMSYPPQIIPRDGSSEYLVISYADRVDVYDYAPSDMAATPSTPTLTFIKTAFSSVTEAVVKVFPFRGFIIVLTDGGNAYFIALEQTLGTFKTYSNISLTSGSYITYSVTTQKVYLNTDSGSIEIQNAPMPYGVIALQEVQ